MTSKNYSFQILIASNTYFLWFFIQTLRIIPVAEDIIIFVVVYGAALLLDLLLQKFLRNVIILKASFTVLTLFSFMLLLFDGLFFYMVIILSYGTFLPGFFSVTTKEARTSNMSKSFLIGLSFYLAFIVDVITRLFYLTYHPFIVYIITPIFCIVFLFSVKKEENVIEKIKEQKFNDTTITKRIQNESLSKFLILLIGCILTFNIILFDNPSLLGSISNLDYNLTTFFILLSTTTFMVFILYYPLNLDFGKFKNSRLLIVIIILTVFFSSIIILFIHSIFNIILWSLSNFLLLLLLIITLESIIKLKLEISGIFLIVGPLVMFLLSSLVGLPFLFIFINSIIMLCLFTVFIFVFKNKLNLSIKTWKPQFKSRNNVISVAIMILISMIPLFANIMNEVNKNPIDRKVLAFYYSWYGNTIDYTDSNLGITDPQGSNWLHWNFGSYPPTPDNYTGTNSPSYGLYDSNDPNLIEYHYKLAKDAGIDALICTWWGIEDNTDTTFENLVNIAERTATSVKLTIYYETFSGRILEKPIAEAIDLISNEVIYIIEKYANSDVFLKVDGKPVIFFYTTMSYSSLIWEKITEKIKTEHDCFLIADIVPTPEPRSELFASFDGIHIYNPTYFINVQKQFTIDSKSLGTIADIYKAMSITAKGYNKLCALTVIPGYDDRVIREPGILIERDNGQTYDYLWQKSLNADADWILITSFNEWHEGSEIEPSQQYGDYYIERTNYWAQIFKDN